jgi:Fe-S-cluster containining protein
MSRRLPLYEAVDREIDAFAGATGLACPSGCGHCCETQTPFVRVDDLAAIAAARVARDLDDAAALRERAAAVGADGPCVLYQPGRRPGGCTEYALRPMLCRLFGFAAVKDKHGAARLALCRVHGRESPEVAAAAVAFVDGGGPVPMFAAWQAESDAVGDDRDARQVPINEALAAALDRALLRAQYGAVDERAG